MRSFYSELFGAKAVNTEWADAWARFDLEGTSFALHAIPADIADQLQVLSVPRENAPVKFIFQVSDIAEQRRRFESLAIPMTQHAWQDPSESFDAVDPEGNIFQISAGIRDQV